MCENLIVQTYFYEVRYLLTVLFNDVANFVHYVTYLTDDWVSCGVLVAWYWQETTEVLAKKSIPVPLFAPQ
jgi:hypothetical protein